MGTPPVPTPRHPPVTGDTPRHRGSRAAGQGGRAASTIPLPGAKSLTRPADPHEGPRTILEPPRRPYPPALDSPCSALALR